MQWSTTHLPWRSARIRLLLPFSWIFEPAAAKSHLPQCNERKDIQRRTSRCLVVLSICERYESGEELKRSEQGLDIKIHLAKVAREKEGGRALEKSRSQWINIKICNHERRSRRTRRGWEICGCWCWAMQSSVAVHDEPPQNMHRFFKDVHHVHSRK